jgi:hypothetical protein
VTAYGADGGTMVYRDIAERLAAFERKFLRKMFGGNKVNENSIKSCYTELTELFGNLDILSFVRISRFNWIGRVYRMNNKRKVSQVFNNNLQGSRLRGRPKTDGGTVYRQILIEGKL